MPLIDHDEAAQPGTLSCPEIPECSPLLLGWGASD
jgi:hypothetical protein